MNKRVYIYREASDFTDQLRTALATANAEFTPVKKNQTAQYGKFADLAYMRASTITALSKHGLSITQHFLPDSDTQMLLVTELGHKSGQWLTSAVPCRVFSNPQQTLSYATYMRRMSYAAMLGLAAETDLDGEGLEGDEQQQEEEDLLAIVRQRIEECETPETLSHLRARVAEEAESGGLTKAAASQLQKEIATKLKAVKGGKAHVGQ